MRHTTLEAWLAWLESVHWREIELGLDRVGRVAQSMNLTPMRVPVVTVGGTNGKGSCIAYMENILAAAGYRVGAYTSPHLTRYNERVRIGGDEADDEDLMMAFDKIDQSRGETSLTYFEFGTLAALDLFRCAEIDVALLEVGMGGRLDAVNIVDPDVAVVTSIGLDHEQYLGGDRERIAAEKAGIFRPQRPAICGDPDPPSSLRDHAEEVGADLQLLGERFRLTPKLDRWDWQGLRSSYSDLPRPGLNGRAQYDNAACALAALEYLDALPVERGHVERGLVDARPKARFQTIPGDVTWVLDVAHNPDAARLLAENLSDHECTGRTLAIFGMLNDKNVEAVVAPLRDSVDMWFAAGLADRRGLASLPLARRIHAALRVPVVVCNTVGLACQQAISQARSGDRIVVFGSFRTVGEVLLDYLKER